MTGLINVFEDASTIRDGGWLKRVAHFERIPDDYGVAWYEMGRCVAVCAPIPWHRVYGWAYRLYWHWRVRCEPSVLSRAFEAGVQSERAIADRARERLEAEHARQLRDAESRGRQALIKDVIISRPTSNYQ